MVWQELLKMFSDVAIEKANLFKPIALRILLGLDHGVSIDFQSDHVQA